MLRSTLLVIGHVLTVDGIGLVQKMIGGIQKHRFLKQALPSLFPSFTLFSLLPSPPLFAPATHAMFSPRLWRSFLSISTKYFIDSRPNLSLLRSSSLRNWSRPISCSRNFFSRICSNSKSAILFVFNSIFLPICELIDLARWVKLNT